MIINSTAKYASFLGKKRRGNTTQKPEHELVQIFWEAHAEAFFGQNTIAPVIGKSVKTLESDRWRGRGIPIENAATVFYTEKQMLFLGWKDMS